MQSTIARARTLAGPGPVSISTPGSGVAQTERPASSSAPEAANAAHARATRTRKRAGRRVADLVEATAPDLAAGRRVFVDHDHRRARLPGGHGSSHPRRPAADDGDVDRSRVAHRTSLIAC